MKHAGSDLSIRGNAIRLRGMETKGMTTMNNVGHPLLFDLALERHRELIRKAEQRALARGFVASKRDGIVAIARKFVGGGVIAAGEWIHGDGRAHEPAVAIETVECLSPAR